MHSRARKQRQGSRTTGTPCAMGYGLYVVSSVRRAVWPPSPRVRHARLDPSIGGSGPHDFAVRRGRARLARRCVHRIPLPTSVTIAIRPSEWRRNGSDPTPDLGFRKSEIFSFRGLDSISENQTVGQISCGEKVPQRREYPITAGNCEVGLPLMYGPCDPHMKMPKRSGEPNPLCAVGWRSGAISPLTMPSPGDGEIFKCRAKTISGIWRRCRAASPAT